MRLLNRPSNWSFCGAPLGCGRSGVALLMSGGGPRLRLRRSALAWCSILRPVGVHAANEQAREDRRGTAYEARMTAKRANGEARSPDPALPRRSPLGLHIPARYPNMVSQPAYVFLSIPGTLRISLRSRGHCRGFELPIMYIFLYLGISLFVYQSIFPSTCLFV
mgnify:CR=1 FL=1